MGERLDRTQEVAGSSPASSTQEAPANRKIWSWRTIAGTWLIYLRATKLLAKKRAVGSNLLTATTLSASVARADSTPVGPLPAGSVATTTTKPGLLVAVALPHARRNSGLVWRIARRYNLHVVRQISEADVRGSVVLVFKVVGRGDTSLVFALTHGDASAKAVKAATHKIHSA